MTRSSSPARSSPPPRSTTALSVRILAGLALAGATFYVVAYVAVALLRMRYPFELEWMEGGSLDNVVRLLERRPLYDAPSLSFIPFIYPPLYFYVAAAAVKLLGATLFPLRLVSLLASLGCFALIYAIVRQDTSSRAPAWLAVGLFAATYREGGAWLDIARVDSLFLLLLLGAYLALRSGRAPQWTAALAGVLLSLACLTKQTGLFVLPAFVLALAIADWRRLPVFLGVTALLLGGVSWWLDRTTGHWFLFYVFHLPRYHPIIQQLLRGFWIDDLLGPVGLALALGCFHFFGNAGRIPARRLWLDGLVCGAMVLAAYATRIRVGSYDNVVIPAYAAAAIVFGLGLAALAARRDEVPPALAVALERFVLVLVIAQLVVLAYPPWKQVPTSKDREAGRQLVESIRRVPGEAWVPSHGYLAVLAGKPRYAHELAMVDVMRAGESEERRALVEEMRSALREKRFTLVVLDHEGWLKKEVEPHYQLYARMFGKDEKQLFWPLTGYYTRPDFVWVPK